MKILTYGARYVNLNSKLFCTIWKDANKVNNNKFEILSQIINRSPAALNKNSHLLRNLINLT